jgi:hypothetical protein
LSLGHSVILPVSLDSPFKFTYIIINITILISSIPAELPCYPAAFLLRISTDKSKFYRDGGLPDMVILKFIFETGDLGLVDSVL